VVFRSIKPPDPTPYLQTETIHFFLAKYLWSITQAAYTGSDITDTAGHQSAIRECVREDPLYGFASTYWPSCFNLKGLTRVITPRWLAWSRSSL